MHFAVPLFERQQETNILVGCKQQQRLFIGYARTILFDAFAIAICAAAIVITRFFLQTDLAACAECTNRCLTIYFV